MPTFLEIAAVTAAIGSGLVAGLCFTFASFLMRSLDELGGRDAIRAMQAINRTILRSIAMVVWFGSALVGVAMAIASSGERFAVAGAVLYVLGGILVTGRGNVPLNDALDRVDPEGAQASETWSAYRQRWGRWNLLRTVLCTLASVAFVLAA